MSPIFEYGIHERIQQAQRADGQWFKRYQQKGRFGYVWTRWKPVAAKDERANLNPYAGKARLPK
jgi:hypothetical protein